MRSHRPGIRAQEGVAHFELLVVVLVTTLATLTLRFGGGERPLEQCWIPSAGGFVGVYDSEETALREAKARVDWLMESGSEEQRSILKAGFALGVG